MGSVMGKRYDFEVQGSWEQISRVGREAKHIVRSSQPLSIHLGDLSLIQDEDDLVKKWITPAEGEDFQTYRARLLGTFGGGIFKRGLVNLLTWGRAPLELELPASRGLLVIRPTVRPERYNFSVLGSGIYEGRVSEIGEDLTEFLREQKMRFTYGDSEALI